MTVQTERLHAGAVRPTPTASPPADADLQAQLDAARAAARAAPSPETLAAHYAAYAALHRQPILIELAWVWVALAVMLAAPLLLWAVGGGRAALCGVGVLLLWLAMPWVLGRVAGD